MKSISIESLDIISCSSVSYIVSSIVVLLCWCIVVLVYCRVGELLDVHTWSTYILSSCCIVMLSYVHTWFTHLHSILLRNHTWELHWNADNDDDDNIDGQWHTLNLYIYLKNAYSKIAFGAPFFGKGWIFTKSDFLIGPKTIDSLLFLIITL